MMNLRIALAVLGLSVGTARAASAQDRFTTPDGILSLDIPKAFSKFGLGRTLDLLADFKNPKGTELAVFKAREDRTFDSEVQAELRALQASGDRFETPMPPKITGAKTFVTRRVVESGEAATLFLGIETEVYWLKWHAWTLEDKPIREAIFAGIRVDASKVAAFRRAQERNQHGCGLGQEGKFEAAVHEFDLAIAECPRINEYRFNRGLCRYQQKDYAGALQDFSCAVMLWDGSGMAWLYLGNTHYVLGNWALAVKALERALAEDAVLEAEVAPMIRKARENALAGDGR